MDVFIYQLYNRLLSTLPSFLGTALTKKYTDEILTGCIAKVANWQPAKMLL